MSYSVPDICQFEQLAQAHGRRGDSGMVLIPIYRRLMSDALTPVLAYRRLVAPDDRMAPSFLFESVVGGDRVGRYSYLGSRPAAQFVARGVDVRYVDMVDQKRSRCYRCDDPLQEMRKVTEHWRPVKVEGLPGFSGGWVGFAGYDTVRYVEGQKLCSPPPDDRGLPDLHMGLYRQIVAFDHVQKILLVINHVLLDEHASIQAAFESGCRQLDDMVTRIATPRLADTHRGEEELPVGQMDLNANAPSLPISNMGQGGYQQAVEIAKRFIAAGDVFQVVPSQRFELCTMTDPFDIYRALRVVNPSPYMFYLQIEGAMLVGSSPEILCRVHNGVVTSRPLAGTRRRGRQAAEDRALETELLDDPKDRAEHVMLVDLSRNDVGRVASPASVRLPELMAVERYSHVMHISSTVTGDLAKGLTCWDALRHALPVGTVSGAPKVRAMQIIDQLEPVRRGPYAGAVGHADFFGNMDMAIALRTMVVIPARSIAVDGSDRRLPPRPAGAGRYAEMASGRWLVHIQVGAGVVADSVPEAEHQETVHKAAAMAKAVELAQKAFSIA